MDDEEIKEFEKWHKNDAWLVSGLQPTKDGGKIIFWKTEHRLGEYRKKIVWVKTYEEARNTEIYPRLETTE